MIDFDVWQGRFTPVIQRLHHRQAGVRRRRSLHICFAMSDSDSNSGASRNVRVMSIRSSDRVSLQSDFASRVRHFVDVA
jgi:hypothetical protein